MPVAPQQKRAKSKRVEDESIGLLDGLISTLDGLVGDVFDVAEEALDEVTDEQASPVGDDTGSTGTAGKGEDDGRERKRKASGSTGSTTGPVTINLGLGKLLREAQALVQLPKRKPADPPPAEEDDGEEGEPS